MSRKQFIESHGGTCRNWTWSWSFVNHKNREVIMGYWSDLKSVGSAVILRESWKTSEKGRRQPGYYQAEEHLLLIPKGYRLQLFEMEHGESDGHARINGFTPVLEPATVERYDDQWVARFL